MTDLTTTHLKHLLDQATPGPWKAKDSDCITSEHGEVLWNTDQAVDWNRNDQDVKLAALAPQLAQEVIHLRDALGYLMEETRLAAENSQDVIVQKRVVNAIETTIIKILGEHTEEA
ncbi:hypothetical protein [Corynebacterium kefirresidentii]|uniref:hypothetical protein n=1 Tax=Corynebacterium kefirresidentii TaxID=1979527 RepID=UPI000A3C77F7|nr:hypothetical protein [Corynebacterium kefirresidentii]OUJ22346.1 hypothetical protein CBI45_09165 [Corynebacterium kefirresidentii]